MNENNRFKEKNEKMMELIRRGHFEKNKIMEIIE